MGKKRKGTEKEEKKNDEPEQELPRKRTLLGLKSDDENKKDGIEPTNNGNHTIFRNREKVLVTCSRRIVYRYRHLMLNLVSLLPHCKKDNKIESKDIKGTTLNELVELRNCSHCIFFEIFVTPKDHRKAKPFHDHVFAFSIVDDHVWFRNYQVSVPHNDVDKVAYGGLDKMTLVEVGPRFCLNPIKILSGSFAGQTLYQNPYYISPNQIRALEKKKKSGKYAMKIKAKTKRKLHQRANPLERDEFSDLWK